MGQQSYAANVRAPCDTGNTANDFGCKKYTATTTCRADAIPDTWCGRFVKITAVGGAISYGFSISASADIAHDVAATNAGVSVTVGDYLADGASDQFRVPSIRAGQTMYFVRDASATCFALLRLANDTNGQ